MKYANKEGLKGNTLEKGDVVMFEVRGELLKYRVYFSHLEEGTGNNDVIFDILNLRKYQFASKAYGYDVTSGMWPSVDNGDYPALTRLVIALYDEIEKQAKPMKLTKNQRIEALEAKVEELSKLILSPKEASDDDVMEVGFEDPKFDPENPTVDNIPIPWLCICKDMNKFEIDFLIKKDEEINPFLTCSGFWYNKKEVEPVPFSQWPKLLVDQYNKYREEFVLPELPKY